MPTGPDLSSLLQNPQVIAALISTSISALIGVIIKLLADKNIKKLEHKLKLKEE
jgi:hypothetical protein